MFIYAVLLRRLPAHLLQWPLPWRAAATFPLLAPLGIMMGVPFPTGIRCLAPVAPDTIPWAWATNGCASVISSIAATMLAMSFGFSRVLYLAAVLYLLAAATLGTLRPAPREHASGGGRPARRPSKGMEA